MGLNKGGLDRFGAVAASHVSDDNVPGLVALVAQGDEVHVEAIGTLAIGGRPVERGSLFRIASTTKPITAAATLALVREGLFELDEPVDRLLPELANRRVMRRMDGPLNDTVPAVGPVTVRGLLTFTFGFGMALQMFMATEPWPVVAAATQAGLATIGPPQPDAFVDPDTWIAHFGELPLLAQPGEQWLYNTGSHVLSVLCARAAGMSYDECCADDCGILVGGSSGWYDALVALSDDPARRCQMVRNAQSRLVHEYSKQTLRRQVLAMFDEARTLRMATDSASSGS